MCGGVWVLFFFFYAIANVISGDVAGREVRITAGGTLELCVKWQKGLKCKNAVDAQLL